MVSMDTPLPSFALSLEPLHIWSKLQQLREKAVLLEAPWLRAAAKSQQTWFDDLILYYPGIALVFFLDRLLAMSPSCNSLCEVSQIDYSC